MDVGKPVDKLLQLFVRSESGANDFHEVTPEQLEEYVNEREQDKTSGPKGNLYHQLAIIAKVETNTTDNELDRLLQNGVRTLLIQARFHKPQDVELIFLKVNTAVGKFYMENSFRMPIGVAVEVNGEQLTTGRMRNNEKPFLEVGHIIVLTTNDDYKFCGLKEIVYVENLRQYSDVIRVGDLVRIGNDEIAGKAVKCGHLCPLTVEITKAGYLPSFMNVQAPYYIETTELTPHNKAEVDNAVKNGAHWLVVGGLRSATYLRTLKAHVGDSVGLIGSLNLQYVEEKFIDINDHIRHLEGLWLSNMFLDNLQEQTEKVISHCSSTRTATIGTMPLETCRDFEKFKNHDRLKHTDCLLIQKSSRRKQFPLIVKKLLPVEMKKSDPLPLGNQSCGEAVVNFVVRTISSIPCQGIVVSNCCAKAALAFAVPQIYCPVICVVKDDYTARLLNLHRNLKPVVSADDSAPADVGISFGRIQGFLNSGDFVISIADGMNEASDVCLNLHAFFLPPLVTQFENEEI